MARSPRGKPECWAPSWWRRTRCGAGRPCGTCGMGAGEAGLGAGRLRSCATLRTERDLGLISSGLRGKPRGSGAQPEKRPRAGQGQAGVRAQVPCARFWPCTSGGCACGSGTLLSSKHSFQSWAKQSRKSFLRVEV